LLRPETYYCDGQIRDEVYEFGSFTQSKMYHRNVRCTDCHDPHSTRLKHEGNYVCTSCHQHPGAKYDTPAHHHHPAGSSGASCVECHMPAAPFMEIDLRRDHSLRVPRPDVSVKWQTPNACTGCHLKDTQLALEVIDELPHYADWLAAARDGDEPIARELARLDTWAAQWCNQWYGNRVPPHFADALGAAWQGISGAAEKLAEVAASRDTPAIIRASALWELAIQDPQRAEALARKSLADGDPQVRAIAIRCLAQLPDAARARLVATCLSDPVKLVRIEAASALAGVQADHLSLSQLKALSNASEELESSLMINADLAGSHVMRGVLAERQGRLQGALEAYRAAIHVQPTVAGPRNQLAQLLEQLREPEAAAQYRAEELKLLQRDAELAPQLAVVQYRYAMTLFLSGQLDAALPVLERATKLVPTNPEYLLAWTLLNERLQRWDAALEGIRALRRLRPENSEYQQLEVRLLQNGAALRAE
jgi:tetratricopeptide (TPR) repeat protein